MKTPKNGFFRDCRRLIALVQCKHPATLPAALFTAVLESAFPFVNIIFGALILDRLLTSDEGVMVLVWWMIGLDFALGCSSRVLRWLCRAEALTADELALGAMTEKCMTMDYQQLETQEIMDKKARAEEGCTSRGSFFEFVWNLSELLCHGLTILYALITVSRLLSSHLGKPLREKLAWLSSDKKRIAYLAEATADITGLNLFPQYLTLLFEVDALFCNDDRHLNNIAVIEQGGQYSYCPIFDNGAGLLSNTQLSPMDIAPPALISALQARPFNTTFTRQMNAARSLYGAQLVIPKLTEKDIQEVLRPILNYYSQRDWGIIADRVEACILTRQKKL